MRPCMRVSLSLSRYQRCDTIQQTDRPLEAAMDSCLLLRISSRRRDIRSSSSSCSSLYRLCRRRLTPRTPCSCRTVVISTAAEVVASTTPALRPNRGLSGSRRLSLSLSVGSCEEKKEGGAVDEKVPAVNLSITASGICELIWVSGGSQGRRREGEDRTIFEGNEVRWEVEEWKEKGARQTLLYLRKPSYLKVLW